MIKRKLLLITYTLVLTFCLSASLHVYAATFDVPIDSSFFEGVFTGAANPAAPAFDEKLEFYDGPFPDDRPASFWSLYEFKKKNTFYVIFFPYLIFRGEKYTHIIGPTMPKQSNFSQYRRCKRRLKIVAVVG